MFSYKVRCRSSRKRATCCWKFDKICDVTAWPVLDELLRALTLLVSAALHSFRFSFIPSVSLFQPNFVPHAFSWIVRCYLSLSRMADSRTKQVKMRRDEYPFNQMTEEEAEQLLKLRDLMPEEQRPKVILDSLWIPGFGTFFLQLSPCLSDLGEIRLHCFANGPT